MSEILPIGWVICSIDEITSNIEQREPKAGKPFSYIDISAIDRETKKIVSPQRLDGADAPSRARKIVKEGDVLVSMTRPNLNAVAMVGKDLDGEIASTGFDVLRAIEIDPRWLHYIVRSPAFVEAMTDLVQGALYPAIKSTDVRRYQIPLAPIPEQKRIADKLDTVLARVDACRERLNRVPHILKRFRQSVLAAATSGQLTADWREDRSEIVEWSTDSLSLLGTVSSGLTKNSKRDDMALKRPYLRVANVYADELKLDEIKEIGLTDSEFLKTKLKKFDLLIVEGNGSLDQIGRVAMWNEEIPNCSHQNHLIRWRAGNRVVPQFGLYFLLSPEGRQQIVKVASSTTGLHTLSVSKVGELQMPVPSIEEQHEIVRRVETLFAFADRLETRLATARVATNRLTPALLAKAFRGELVPQDPNDEPAAELLKRLAAARTATNDKPRRGRAAKVEKRPSDHPSQVAIAEI